MKKFLALTASLLLAYHASATDREATINIDSRVQFQHVTGFGGFSPSPQWQYWLNDSDMDKLFGKADNQLGLTVLRIYMANDKKYWYSGVANAKRAKKYGAFIFASPWSPPASWKSNNSETDGGSLLESHYADWATMLNDYYLYMKKQGADIDAVSIQNEPDWSPSYQSCVWTGEQMAKFLREQGSKIQCKIIAPESVHFTRDVHEPLLNDEGACNNFDILGGHFYGWDGSSYPLAEQKGKEVWMTEFLINERQENDGKNIDWNTDGFLFAKSINDAMLSNMSAWVHYALKRYYGAIGDGQYGTVNNQITKRGYVLSQYAKYVSGTTRVKHVLDDASGQLSSSAYVTESGDEIVLMVINPSADTYTTSISLPFYSKSYTSISTSASLNAKKRSFDMDEETYTPSISVKPYSVNTYIYTKSAPRTDLPDLPDDSHTVFSDGFALTGAGVVPTGWIARNQDETRHAGTYGLGPRIMSFSAEGAMQYAFYFRAGNSQEGSVSYGEESKSRLHLEPGKYTLSYSVEGYKATPSVSAYVRTATGTTLKTQKVTATTSVSDNGSSSRILKTTDSSLEFEIKAAGNYVLKWSTPKSKGGYSEVLVGNIRLYRQPDIDTGISTIDQAHGSNANKVHNTSGQTLNRPQPGINIIDGRKVWIKGIK